MIFNYSTTNIVLLLRYSDFNGIDTIKEHENIIRDKGFCWWVKLGKTPSSTYIQKFRETHSDIAFLYTAGILYKCRILDISNNIPLDSYPKYYDRDIFPIPSNANVLFFKITDIEPIPLDELENYLVLRSGKSVLYNLKKSISSYFLIQNKDNWVKPIHNIRQKRIEKKQQPSINKSSICKYQKASLCSNRLCINYGYQCERPNMCLKFKHI